MLGVDHAIWIRAVREMGGFTLRWAVKHSLHIMDKIKALKVNFSLSRDPPISTSTAPVTWPVKWNKLRFSSMEGNKPHFTKLNCIFKIKFQRRIQFHLLLKVRCFVKCWLGSNTWGLFPFRKFPPIGHSTNQTPWSPLVLLFVTQKC